MKITAILISILILFGCSKPREHKELQLMLEQAIGLKVTSSFEVENFESSSAKDDYVEKYVFKFEEADFKKLSLSINEMKGWKILINENTSERISAFEGHGFNHVISSINYSTQEIRVQFIHE